MYYFPADPRFPLPYPESYLLAQHPDHRKFLQDGTNAVGGMPSVPNAHLFARRQKRKNVLTSPLATPNEVRYFSPLKKKKAGSQVLQIKDWYALLLNRSRFKSLEPDERVVSLSIIDPFLTDMIRIMHKKVQKDGDGEFAYKEDKKETFSTKTALSEDDFVFRKLEGYELSTIQDKKDGSSKFDAETVRKNTPFIHTQEILQHIRLKDTKEYLDTLSVSEAAVADVDGFF